MYYTHLDSIHNLKAPEEIVPFILKFIQPESVLDVGCGTGTWIYVFNKHFKINAIGIDSPFIDRSKIIVDDDLIIKYDLSKRFNLKRKFDLIICLEVAEHLPSLSAPDFILSLTEHSDNIVFSAAIPYQGGQNHLNEQPVEYWFKLFSDKGYYIYDPFREHFWDNSNVEWWYKQNMFFISKIKHNLKLFKHFYIHPDCFKEKIEFLNAELLRKHSLKNMLLQLFKQS